MLPIGHIHTLTLTHTHVHTYTQHTLTHNTLSHSGVRFRTTSLSPQTNQLSSTGPPQPTALTPLALHSVTDTTMSYLRCKTVCIIVYVYLMIFYQFVVNSVSCQQHQGGLWKSFLVYISMCLYFMNLLRKYSFHSSQSTCLSYVCIFTVPLALQVMRNQHIASITIYSLRTRNSWFNRNIII